jgi:hypothetical protein
VTRIDPKQLEDISGGVRQGPNGEGCTGPFSPRPQPTPTNPLGPSSPFQLPGASQPLR